MKKFKNLKYQMFLMASVFVSMLMGIFVSPYVLPQTSAGSLAPLYKSDTQSMSAANGILAGTRPASNITGDPIVTATQSALPSVVTIQASDISSSTREEIGSGFVVRSDGVILTSKHVIADSSLSYSVLTADNKRYLVNKIYSDPTNDIAVIRINASNLTPISLGDSSSLKLGQSVIAIGTQLGQFTNSVTSGIISGLNRGVSVGSSQDANGSEILNDAIQTDASINPGNSGGPLVDLNGQVIGINTAISASAQNIGFAVPVNDAKDFLATIR